MKKIPTLFERNFEDHKVVGISDKVTPGMEWVLKGEGVATIKWDGTACAIIDGKLYKRYDAKKGKKAPAGAIPCCEPDPVTGHHPHWVRVDANKPENRWIAMALWNSCAEEGILPDGTYEAVGPHIQGNPHLLEQEVLIRHGAAVVRVERSFEGIKNYLEENKIEGLVFWKDGEPQCKIKRSDFGFAWPV